MAKRVGSRGRALLGAADLAVMARSGSDVPRSRRMRLLVSLLGALVLASGLGIAPAQAIEPVERGWKGKTSQGLPVYFALALDGDEVLTDALGPVLADSHLAVRRSEWAAYSQQDVEVAQRGHFLRY
jgi:hypothetical protein